MNTPHMQTNQDEIRLQKTCQLVEEWAEKYQATIDVVQDYDVAETVNGGLTGLIEGNVTVKMDRVERRYRVANNTEAALTDATLIFGFISRWNAGYKEPARKVAVKLAENGYSQAAINEVLNS